MKKRKLLIMIVCAILLQILPTEKTLALENEIVVKKGHQFILKIGKVRRVAVGNDRILNVSLIDGGESLLIVGLEPGSTDLILWKKGKIEKVLVKVFENFPELEVGEKTDIIKFLRRLGVRNPSIHRVQGKTLISGSVPEKTLPLVNEISRNFKDTVWAIKNIEENRREIIYRLRFIEISRGDLKNFGVHWPESETLSAFAEKEKHSTFLVQSSFDIILKNLIAHGKARLLAEPTLVCEENSSASFHAGGQIPIVIIGDNKRDVIWKNYGLLLRLTPRARNDGEVVTEIETEMSTIDHATGTGDIPGIITRKLSTSFSVPFGETIVLSGLVRSETLKDVSRFPLLGNIPILGELFKSRRFRNHHSELIVTVTPILLTKDGNREIIERMKNRYEEMGEEVRIRLLD